MRYIEAKVYTTTGRSNSSALVAGGSNGQLRAELDGPELPASITRAIAKMAASLHENDYL